MKITVYNVDGAKVSDREFEPSVFGDSINESLLNQAIRCFLFNKRKASAVTKTRAEVNRSGTKIFKQKGTGNARHGSKRAPIFVGGGIAHGPTLEQNWYLKFPRKMRQGAMRSVLNLFAKDSKLNCVEGFESVEMKTKKADEFFNTVLVKKESLRGVLFVLNGKMENARKALQNLEYVTVRNADNLTTYDVVKARTVFFVNEAFDALVKRLEVK